MTPRQLRTDNGSSIISTFGWAIIIAYVLLLIGLILFIILQPQFESQPSIQSVKSTASPIVSIEQSPTLTKYPTSVPALTATQEPSSPHTPSVDAYLYQPPNLNALENLALELINQSRTEHGLSVVEWDHFAAQIGTEHSIEMVTNVYLSHWNLSGFGPDIRYSLAGGTEWVQENVYSYWQRYDNGQPIPFDDWETIIREAHNSLMNSQGHRDNILSPEHTHVGVGMAYDFEKGEFRLAQEFINHYIEIDPISRSANPGDIVSISGRIQPGCNEPLINLVYEQFPQSMTVQELNQTSTYSSPSKFVEYYSSDIRGDGNFVSEIALGNDPGLYHILIWVTCGELKTHAVDLVISAPEMQNSQNYQPVAESTKTGSEELSNAAPEFNLNTLDGRNLSLSEYVGDPILVVFFTSWCPYCQNEAPSLKLIFEQYQSQGINILAVNVTDNDDIADVELFVQNYGWEFPILLDYDGKVGDLYHQSGVPMNVFIDRKGAIKFVGRGAMDFASIEQVVVEMLSE